MIVDDLQDVALEEGVQDAVGRQVLRSTDMNVVVGERRVLVANVALRPDFVIVVMQLAQLVRRRRRRPAVVLVAGGGSVIGIAFSGPGRFQSVRETLQGGHRV